MYFYSLRSYILLLYIILMGFLNVSAQEDVKGIVFDSNTKQRVAGVYFYNTSNEKGSFNNLRGEFHLSAEVGDMLILAKEGYFPDTITIKNNTTLIINLTRSSIWLKEVNVMAKKSPQEELEAKKEEYNSAFKENGPLLSTGNGGAGLSISALYSLISKEGRNARYLQKIIERDYRDAIIDYRFTTYLVKSLTNLEGDRLADFMFYYRPSYYFILNSTDYALGIYIKKNFQEYQINPNARKVDSLYLKRDE